MSCQLFVSTENRTLSSKALSGTYELQSSRVQKKGLMLMSDRFAKFGNDFVRNYDMNGNETTSV